MPSKAVCPKSVIVEYSMLLAIAAVFIILWLLGLLVSYTLDGFIYVLLIVAVILILMRIIGGSSR